MGANKFFEKQDYTEKKRQILTAAIKVFACKGFHYAKIEEIASDAGVGKGTVYEYFKSKQDLFQEMIKYINSLYLEKILTKLEEKDTFKEKVQCLLATQLKFALEHKEMAQILMTDMPPLDDDFKKWFLECRKRQIQFIQDNVMYGIERGEIGGYDSYLIAGAIAGAINYFGDSIMLNGQDMAKNDLEAFSATFVDLLYRGIAK